MHGDKERHKRMHFTTIEKISRTLKLCTYFINLNSYQDNVIHCSNMVLTTNAVVNTHWHYPVLSPLVLVMLVYSGVLFAKDKAWWLSSVLIKWQSP